jgi:hypothetical protein
MVDSGTGAACPADLPSAHTPCSPEGRECEYGSSPVQDCNTVATCTAAEWVITEPNSSGNACRTELDMKCPTLYADVMKGTACPSLNLLCDYPRGRCACVPPGVIGALPVDGSTQGTWECQTAAAGCPDTRPLLGTPCTQEGANCAYGTCIIQGGTTETCEGGIWQTDVTTACPASAQ